MTEHEQIETEIVEQEELFTVRFRRTFDDPINDEVRQQILDTVTRWVENTIIEELRDLNLLATTIVDLQITAVKMRDDDE